MSDDTELHPVPEFERASIRKVMMPRDTNAVGTIFGGVILSQIDLAAAVEAHRSFPGRLVTVAMDKVDFKAPVFVGDLVSFSTETERIGRSSIKILVEVWSEDLAHDESRKVTEATFVFVAIDDRGRTRVIPS